MAEKPEKSGWNWGAFLFGALWYLYKGMLEKGILLIILGLFALLFFGLAGTVVVGLYCGFRGTEDYYVHWKQRRRLLK